MWEGFVELLRVLIFSAAHLCAGSLGGAVLLVSFGLRLALLPLTLHLARQARARQERLAALAPALAALQRRHAGDPARLLRETRALHRAHGVRLLAPSGVVGLLLQLPVLGALFTAVRQGFGSRVRFLWVADLARPDFTLVLVATALTTAVTATAPAGADAAVPGGASVPTAALIAVVIATLAFLWSASSAIALSAGAGSLVSAVQNWLLARDARRTRAAAA